MLPAQSGSNLLFHMHRAHRALPARHKPGSSAYQRSVERDLHAAKPYRASTGGAELYISDALSRHEHLSALLIF